VLWTALDGWRAEAAHVDLTPGGVRADGTQLGVEPLPYRADYWLDAGENLVTRLLEVEAKGEGWARRLRISHNGEGEWRCETEEEGDVGLPPAGGDVAALTGALDCDLAFSPLTNLMPIRRHGLHEHSGTADFLMAWVSVPDLGVRPSRQRYEHVRIDAGRAVVRYSSGSFVSDLEVDGDGLVVVYPQLARRVDAPSEAR
jgi:hypothetical protein